MKVKFVPQDVEYEIKPGQTVMELAHEKGIPIRSTCNGMPSCAECRVKVIDGDWNTNPPARKELNLIGTGHYIDQRRLSCQMLCFGDIVVDTSEQIEKAAEGPVTKKFLTKIHKTSAQETHSVGGVLLEQDEQLLKELKSDVRPDGGSSSADGESGGSADVLSRGDRGERGQGGDRHRDRDRGRDRGDRGQGGDRGHGNDRGQQAREGGGPRGEGGGHGGGGRNRRRRRGRGGGGGGQRDQRQGQQQQNRGGGGGSNNNRPRD